VPTITSTAAAKKDRAMIMVPVLFEAGLKLNTRSQWETVEEEAGERVSVNTKALSRGSRQEQAV
jgi:hypothetical protein